MRETFKSVIYKHPGCLWYLQNPYNDSPQLRMNYLYSKYSVHMPFLSVTPPSQSLPIPTQHSDLWLTSMRQSCSHSLPLYFIHHCLLMLLHTSAGTRFNFFTVKKKINDCGTKNGSHTLQVINITSLFIERGLIPS